MKHRAIASFIKTCTIQWEGYLLLGIAYGKNKKYPEAIEMFKKAINFDSKLAISYFNMGIIYTELENYNEAINSYEKCLKIDPEYLTADLWDCVALSKRREI